ncbi:MAG: C-GCAxxG-C-C family protein [Nitrososphaerales archaeon]|nr:C-GCAxxG-C-C family protein [Nitrososphaerales archaeon]
MELEILKLIKQVHDDAKEYNMKYPGCSQAVLGSLQKNLNIGGLDSFKAATLLVGGVARRGETCGAVIGALMALGIVIGRERIEDIETYQKAFEPAYEFCDKFVKEYGSTLCCEIQKRLYGMCFNLRDRRGHEQFLLAGGRSEEGCPKVSGFAAKTMAEIILRLKNRV